MDAERGFQLVLLAIAVVLVFLLLRPFLSVILGAILLAYLLSAPYDWLAPRVGERIAAISLILATLSTLLVPVVLLTSFVFQGVNELQRAIGQGDTVTEVDGVRALLEEVFGIQIEEGMSAVELLRQGDVLELAQSAVGTFGGISEVFVHLTVLLFTWYYLMKDGDRLLSWMGNVAPMPEETQTRLVTRVNELMYFVVVGNFAVAVVDGLLVALGLLVLGFDNVIFWAFVSVFLALIPLVGSMLVWVPAATYLVILGNVTAGIGLFIYGFLVVGSVDNVLRPFLGAPEIGLDPGLFVIGVLAGLSLFGAVGIFYGPVLLVLAKAVTEIVGRDLQ
ncbi:AI-2E family transporter [Salinirussus salinus]|uniref:AI-2E family transporter n=1 Tax=Salinirussus salinus TaxID=1198300 RepID=UPI00135BC3B7|nr:AI-2E family transporter [Salinirussus salinus]